MKLSIIIPTYCPEENDIMRCLDSIYNQVCNKALFEVICVDDCSPTVDTQRIISGYIHNGKHPSNLQYYRQTKNTRQGGARNTGFRMAKGEYVTCIDQDDFYLTGSLNAMLAMICDNPSMVMFDNAMSDENCNIKVKNNYIGKNKPGMMTGTEFMRCQEVSWMPWGYIYNRRFIVDNDFRFEENVRFEDVDFVLECIANAPKIKFEPQTIVCHRETSTQTSVVGNDRERNIDLIKIAHRVGRLADRLKGSDNECWRHVMGHHDFMYLILLKKYIWRLKRRDISTSITDYPPSNLSDKKALAFIRKNPKITSVVYSILAPALHAAYFIYSRLKK